jgi:pentatricopeptide repeat protein
MMVMLGTHSTVRVMDKVSESGMKPDAFTYTPTTLGCCSNNDLDSALEIFSGMDKDEREPNGAAYSAMINGFVLK